MSHPEELELLEHGRTGWNRFDGVEHEASPFDHGDVWRDLDGLRDGLALFRFRRRDE